MKLPTLAVDTANHVVYGAAIALAATLAATALGQPATAIAGVAVLAFAAGKEAADYILARRAAREGRPPTHRVEWADLLGTLAGGLAVVLARLA